MRRYHIIVLCLLIPGLIACEALQPPSTPLPTATLGPTATPVPTRTPVPTWTPTPVPTPTPIPPVRLKIEWPTQVSPLTPLPVAARLIPPTDILVYGRLSARVVDPRGQTYATFALTERDGNRYTSREALHLPLEPVSGLWRVVVDVDLGLPWTGPPSMLFVIEPVTFREWGAPLPAGVSMRIPTAFAEVVAQGGADAGGRVWTYDAGEVGLWWVPGPMEKLSVSGAVVVLEATYTSDDRHPAPATPVVAQPLTWGGREAFEFAEVWPDPQGGQGRAWVIRGDDFRLYVLRVRAVGTAEIPGLHLDVAYTFGFSEDSG